MYLLICIVLVILLLIITKSRTPMSYRIKKGKEIAENSSLILATCIRDAEDKIKTIESYYYYFSKFFKRVKLIVMENDSKDKTREKLFKLKRRGLDLDVVGCGLNVKFCSMKLNNIRSGRSSTRVRRMAHIRNILIDHIRTIQQNYEFCLIFDGDLNMDINTDGMLESFYYLNKKNVDAISAYTMTYFTKMFGYFYDEFAYERLNHSSIPILFNQFLFFFRNGLIKVKSCFNGLTIYKLPFADHIKYYENTNLCEHISFHRKMNTYINTNFVCNIKSFDSD